MFEAFVADARSGFPEGVEVVPVSAVAQRGLDALKETLWKRVDARENKWA
jgi:hypothetical protein